MGSVSGILVKRLDTPKEDKKTESAWRVELQSLSTKVKVLLTPFNRITINYLNFPLLALFFHFSALKLLSLELFNQSLSTKRIRLQL